MRSILLAHAEKYPLMEPRDAVKLIYQNEFGGGHLIRDEAACLEYLRREYDSVPLQHNTPLLEEIGNGMVRVNLSAWKVHPVSVDALGKAFIHSSSVQKGNEESFRKKLAILSKLTLDGAMPFSAQELESYLADYERDGFPPVSHSEAYRNAYQPAYRVIRSDCLTICIPQGVLQNLRIY